MYGIGTYKGNDAATHRTDANQIRSGSSEFGLRNAVGRQLKWEGDHSDDVSDWPVDTIYGDIFQLLY